MDQQVHFRSVTGADQRTASQYLEAADGDLQSAVSLYLAAQPDAVDSAGDMSEQPEETARGWGCLEVAAATQASAGANKRPRSEAPLDTLDVEQLIEWITVRNVVGQAALALVTRACREGPIDGATLRGASVETLLTTHGIEPWGVRSKLMKAVRESELADQLAAPEMMAAEDGTNHLQAEVASSLSSANSCASIVQGAAARVPLAAGCLNPESKWTRWTCGERAYYHNVGTQTSSLRAPEEGVRLEQEQGLGKFEGCNAIARKMDALYRVGVRAEVYSRSGKAWRSARVSETLDNLTVRLVYQNHLGDAVRKTLPVSHPDLRAPEGTVASSEDPAAFEAALPTQAAMPKTRHMDKVNTEEGRVSGGSSGEGAPMGDEFEAAIVEFGTAGDVADSNFAQFRQAVYQNLIAGRQLVDEVSAA